MKIHEDSESMKELLLGNEAIARGAIESGVKVATSYPGTPASEIMETLAKAAPDLDLHTEWSTNEKVAFEVATGASITGVRSMVSMKNAGLNWIMDPFMTIVYGGIRGGFLIVVADDPGAHYSSNEQDTRTAAAYAEIPCLEPATQQEAKDMTKFAFDLSEKIELPIYLRTVTRISHASGEVEFGEINKEERKPVFDRHYKKHYRWNVYGKTGPIERHKWLKKQQTVIREETKGLPWDEIETPNGAEYGVIASGVGASYAKEAVNLLGSEKEIAFLKIGTCNPLPRGKISKILQNVEKVLVVEEGTEFVERRIKEIAKDEAPDVEIFGRLTDHMPEVGEINTDIVTKGLNKITNTKTPGEKISKKVKKEIEGLITPRSSTFCAGCPHLGTYWALREAIKKLGKDVQIINGDIGCYEIAGYGIFAKEIESDETNESQKYPMESPYEILDTNYVMGSGIDLMQGQYQAGYDDGPLVAMAGDSTFFHAALPEIVNAVYNDAGGLFIVVDNRWTAMTGHHPNPGTGEKVTGESAEKLDIGKIARGIGVEHVREVDAYDLDEVTKVIQEEMEREDFSMIISKRACTIEALRRGEFEKIKVKENPEECISCNNCVDLGCPAITYENEIGGIDRNICVDCGLCAQVCPTTALTTEVEK